MAQPFLFGFRHRVVVNAHPGPFFLSVSLQPLWDDPVRTETIAEIVTRGSFQLIPVFGLPFLVRELVILLWYADRSSIGLTLM